MKVPKKTTSEDFVVPEPGVYRMEFTHYDEPELSKYKKDNGDDQWRIKLEFIIRDDESEFDGSKIMAWYGWSMHEKSNLYPVIKALLGRDLEEDEEPDLDDLLGKHIMGTLDQKKSGSGDDERVYARLKAASPIRKKKAATETVKPVKSKPVIEDDEELWDEADVA